MKDKKSWSTKAVEDNLDVHLPSDYGWKILGRLVEDLRYSLTEGEYREINGIIRNRNLAAYLSLSEAWGPQSTATWGTNPAKARAKYQIAALLKKFRFPSDNTLRRKAAIAKLLDAERTCAAYNLEGHKAVLWAKDDRMCNVFTYARNFLKHLLGEDKPLEEELTHWSRHGPGANLDTKDGRTSLYDKYGDWPYSCTKDAVPYARSAIEADERWRGALENSYRERYNIPKHMILDMKTFYANVITVVDGNRIAFVPKNAQTDRSIAIEPSLNLYLQLGVDGFIRRRLKRWDIDLDDQRKNSELARLGSRDWDWSNSFCTLDLKAASDSVSIKICEALLPRSWFSYLMKIRSPQGVLDGESIVYEKISSMGNGYTFALETAIFAAIVFGVQREFLGRFEPTECAIYGDDIIVRKSIVRQTVQALELAGFSINPEKSFMEGPFRESCGADWFMGKPVRPVFLECLPTSIMGLFNDYNRLQRVLSLRFMVEDSLCSALLYTWIPSFWRELTGPYSDEDFDSYRHVSTPSGRRLHCLWHWKRLVLIPRTRNGRDFLIRKLMHDLRGGPQITSFTSPRDKWRGGKLTSSGSRFAIPKQGLVKASVTSSVASEWRSEYAEL